MASGNLGIPPCARRRVRRALHPADPGKSCTKRHTWRIIKVLSDKFTMLLPARPRREGLTPPHFGARCVNLVGLTLSGVCQARRRSWPAPVLDQPRALSSASGASGARGV